MYKVINIQKETYAGVVFQTAMFPAQLVFVFLGLFHAEQKSDRYLQIRGITVGAKNFKSTKYQILCNNVHLWSHSFILLRYAYAKCIPCTFFICLILFSSCHIAFIFLCMYYILISVVLICTCCLINILVF